VYQSRLVAKLSSGPIPERLAVTWDPGHLVAKGLAVFSLILRRGWVWLHCRARECSHKEPAALAPFVIRWGAASSDILRGTHGL
jgi:hypothetical protein